MRHLTLLTATLAVLSLAACKGGGDSDDTDGGEEAQSCLSTDGESPSVISATIECTVQDVSDPPVVTLLVASVVTDPQGDFTLQSFGDHRFRSYLAANGAMTNEIDTLICQPDGNCDSSIPASQVGVSCGTMDNYYFTVQYADDEGNLSPECRLEIK